MASRRPGHDSGYRAFIGEDGVRSSLRPDIGARAIKRLVLGFLAASLLLSLLHYSKDKVGSQGYSYVTGEILPEIEIEEPVRAPAKETFGDYIPPTAVDEEQGRFQHITSVNDTICEKRREDYRLLVDNRNPRSTLKWTGQHDLANDHYTLASSQALYSDSCWTSYDRYRHYHDTADDSLNRCNALKQPYNRTAVVLQLESNNLFTEDATLNLRALILEAGWYLNMDVILLQNVGSHEEYNPDKVPEEFRKLLINFEKVQVFAGYPNEAKATNMVDRPSLNYGGGEFSRYVTAFYHFTQIWFFKQRPEYDFAYFIESHVRSFSDYKELLQKIKTLTEGKEAPDFVTLDPIVLTKPTTYWSGKESGLPESYFKNKLVVYGVSRRLVAAMEDNLMAGINALHEAFLPATAIKNNYNIYTLAHPIIKRNDNLVFGSYLPSESQNFVMLNLKDSAIEGNGTGWLHGGTFAADTVRWVDDLKQTQWIDTLYQDWRHEEELCMPGLLVYPVSGR